MRKSDEKYITWLHNYPFVESILLDEIDSTNLEQGFPCFRNNVLVKSLQDIRMSVEIISAKNLSALVPKASVWVSDEEKANPLIHTAIKSSIRHLMKTSFDLSLLQNINELIDQEIESCVTKLVDCNYVMRVAQKEKVENGVKRFYGYEDCRSKMLDFDTFVFQPEYDTLLLRIFFGFKGHLLFENRSLEQRFAEAVVNENYFSVCVALSFLKSRQLSFENVHFLLQNAKKENFLTVLTTETDWLVL